MDEVGMIDWIEQVWKPFVRSRGRMLLLMDWFSAHRTQIVIDRFTDCNTDVVFVPAGYTSKLQVLDVGLNKPFKSKIRDKFELFMLDAVSNNLPYKPKRVNVSGWIDQAWEGITTSSITNTWRRIGIAAQERSIDWDIIEGDDDDIFTDTMTDLVVEGVDVSTAAEDVFRLEDELTQVIAMA
jgi:DDE superfamily endonuclease